MPGGVKVARRFVKPHGVGASPTLAAKIQGVMSAADGLVRNEEVAGASPAARTNLECQPDERTWWQFANTLGANECVPLGKWRKSTAFRHYFSAGPGSVTRHADQPSLRASARQAILHLRARVARKIPLCGNQAGNRDRPEVFARVAQLAEARRRERRKCGCESCHEHQIHGVEATADRHPVFTRVW